MRGKALIGAIAMMAGQGAACAQDNVTVFGILDAYVDYSKAGAQDAVRVQSGGISGSRLGFRGRESLGAGRAAIFHLEAGVNLDDGRSGQGGLLFGRQAWVGLATAAGELTVGRQYSPNFFTLVTYGLGGGMAWGNASNYFTDPSALRANNSVSYASPLLAGFKARAFYALGEDPGSTPGARIGNIYSGSLQYDSGPVSAGLAIETRRTTLANTDRFYAAGASYRFERAKLAVLAQARRDDIDTAASDALEVGLQIPAGPGSLLIDAGRLRNRSVERANATSFSLRYDYTLSKRTMLYGGAAYLRNDARSTFGINGNTGAALAVAAGDDPRALILGVRHAF